MESSCRYSACDLFNPLSCHARIEPGAILRDKVDIGEHVVVMMGAVINIGASIGEDTMIDMNAVVGGRAIIKKRCHIGAGSVIAGVIEPASAKPVIIEDDVMIGANAVILEGVHIGKHAVVGAGAVVLEDVEENCVVAGCPAKVLKRKDIQTIHKNFYSTRFRNHVIKNHLKNVAYAHKFLHIHEEMIALNKYSFVKCL